MDRLNKIIEMINILSDEFYRLKNNICLPYDLSATQTTIILDIYKNPNETKITDICKRLKKSTNSISPLINRLVEKGFLYKYNDPNDKRIFKVGLTDKSKSITSQIRTDVEDYTLPVAEELTKEEINEIEKYLELLIKAVF